MAISFNFNSSPVKEIQCKCINCLHCHKLSSDIFRCNYNLEFMFINEKELHCNNKFKELRNYERSLYFSFCTLQIVNGISKYADTGLGLFLDSNLSDEDILNRIRTDENIINNSIHQLSKLFDVNNITVVPILTFEKYRNEKDGNTKWHYISNVLSLEEAMTCLDNLNKSKN